MEATYFSDLKKDGSPWASKALAFLGQPVITPEDLKLAPVPGIDSNTDAIHLDSSDERPIMMGWGLCLAGMFAGRFPGKDAVNTLMQRWPCKARVTYHSRGWMFFQFPTEKAMGDTLRKGPFSVFGTPLFLEIVDENFRFDKKMDTNLPVWVRLPDLPPVFWTKSVLEKIASSIGTPLKVDEATLRKDFLDGPRLQVRIDSAVKPRASIELIDVIGRKIIQKITYETQPRYCPKCHMYGHYGSECAGPDARRKAALAARKTGGKRPPSRGPNGRSRSRPKRRQEEGHLSHPPQGQKGHKQTNVAGPSTTPTANQFDAIAPPSDDPKNPDTESSYHSSVVPIPLAHIPTVSVPPQTIPETLEAESLETNKENGAATITPLSGNDDGNPKPSSPPCASVTSVSCPVSTHAEKEQENQTKPQEVAPVVLGLSANPNTVVAGKKDNKGGNKKLTSKEMAALASKKLSIPGNETDNSPSKKKKRGRTPKKKN